MVGRSRNSEDYVEIAGIVDIVSTEAALLGGPDSWVQT
jgi:hypothetical protein